MLFKASVEMSFFIPVAAVGWSLAVGDSTVFNGFKKMDGSDIGRRL